jgi:hypothetical protein
MLSHSLFKKNNNNVFLTPRTFTKEIQIKNKEAKIITENYDAGENDDILLVSSTSQIKINLPSIDNKSFIIKDITGKKNICIVKCDGNIDGENMLLLSEYESYTLICKLDNEKTNYYIL